MIVLYILACITIVQGVISLVGGKRAARYMRAHASAVPALLSGSRSRLAVFCPCKGVDHEFEQNVRSILEQDHENFVAYFVVESKDDTAYRALNGMGVEQVLVAGQAVDCGQKVHNLTYAVGHAGDQADVYVFCDSDARYPRGWLRNLTEPLGHPAVWVSTGYRWYVADRFHIPTLLRSAWNATVVSMLGDHASNFAWGGSMALRRETFHRLGIPAAWRGAVSDDYAVTRAAQRAGMRIQFVPSCLIPSYGACSFRELLEFTTRQIIITRVYHPRLWRIGFVAQTIFNVTFLSLAAMILVDGYRRPLQWAGLWLAIYGLSAARSAVRLAAVRSVLRDPSLWRFAWFYILSSPVVALLYQYNMVFSALTSNIEWRQIHYSLISPNETRVRRSSASAS